MKLLVKIIFIFIVFIVSCTSNNDTLQGRWVVDNVNFDFDERRNTPEMIHQMGREESKNELIFKNDSIVYIKMSIYDGEYHYTINENSEIRFKDVSGFNILGVMKENKIYSEQNTAIGKMRVVFVKETK